MVGTAFVLAGQITGPLRVLVQAVSRVNRGNLSYRSTIKGRDELGLLSRALEDMVDNIAAGEEAHERVMEHENELQMATQLKNALSAEAAADERGLRGRGAAFCRDARESRTSTTPCRWTAGASR